MKRTAIVLVALAAALVPAAAASAKPLPPVTFHGCGCVGSHWGGFYRWAR